MALENPGLRLLIQGLRFATILQRLTGQRAFAEQQLKGFEGCVVVEVTGEKGGCFFLEVEKGRVRIGAGEKPNPRARVTVSKEDFFRCLTGEVSGMILELSGRVRCQGEPQATWLLQGIAQQIRAFRERPGILGKVSRWFSQRVIARSGVDTRFPPEPPDEKKGGG